MDVISGWAKRALSMEHMQGWLENLGWYRCPLNLGAWWELRVLSTIQDHPLEQNHLVLVVVNPEFAAWDPRCLY